MIAQDYIDVLSREPSLKQFRESFHKLLADEDLSEEETIEVDKLYYDYWWKNFRETRHLRKKP